MTAWQQIVQLYLSGDIRAIGVSNFEPEHVQAIVDATGVLPVINQVELHPYFQQRKLRQFNSDREIVTEAWSPLPRASVPPRTRRWRRWPPSTTRHRLS